MNRNIKEDTEDPVVQELFADLITASHILHFHNVLDGYGHVSCRNPYNPSSFFMARDLAPGLVKSRNDLVEYYVDNAEPVLPNAPKGFLERCIHSELLKRFPAMNSVVHSHSPETIPFGITSVPMRACSSLSGFLGTRVPKFDAADYYTPDDGLPHDLLIRTGHQGAKLAEFFSDDALSSEAQHTVVLMKAHGFATIAGSLESAVFQAMYTQTNARILASTIALRGAYFGDATGDAGIRYLSEQESHDVANGSAKVTVRRPWYQWAEEVKTSSLYVNSERA